MQQIVSNVYTIRMKYGPTTHALSPEWWNEEVTAATAKAARRQFRKTKGLHPTEPLICTANVKHERLAKGDGK